MINNVCVNNIINNIIKYNYYLILKYNDNINNNNMCVCNTMIIHNYNIIV